MRCLRFYENERAVRTASSEQVRQPIFRTGSTIGGSSNPGSGPLKQALGPVLDRYPAVPEFTEFELNVLIDHPFIREQGK